MYQPLIKFHPYPAIITQVLSIFTYYLWLFCILSKKKSNGSKERRYMDKYQTSE